MTNVGAWMITLLVLFFHSCTDILCWLRWMYLSDLDLERERDQLRGRVGCGEPFFCVLI